MAVQFELWIKDLRLPTEADVTSINVAHDLIVGILCLLNRIYTKRQDIFHSERLELIALLAEDYIMYFKANKELLDEATVDQYKGFFNYVLEAAIEDLGRIAPL